MTPLKTIKYRGGVVTFSIPATWHEEYEPEGGGTFYEDRPDSGTLRLNVITAEAPDNMQELSAYKALLDSQGPGVHQITPLSNGNAVARYVHMPTEKGKQLQIHYWEVASSLPPRHMRIAVFSYTILANQASDAYIQKDLELLNKCITESVFSQKAGISGTYPSKPWWRFW
jgi:hypothetical protein